VDIASESKTRPSGVRRTIDAIGRRLPRGWRHFLGQLALFICFDIAYEATRGLSDSARAVAIRHAEDVVSAEKSLGLWHEQAIQQWALHAPGVVLEIADWTYLQCQFTITFAFLLWVYLWRNDAWTYLRNTVIIGFTIGMLGYTIYPCAPPRLLPEALGYGFVDTLEHGSASAQGGLIEALANPYAAMPSLHTATALLVGSSGVLLCRSILGRAIWALYPALVLFSIVATANHFILDAIAGAVVFLIATVLSLSISWYLRGRALEDPHDRSSVEIDRSSLARADALEQRLTSPP
jgi:membrane-associated phospholipid phosphatase